MNVDLDKHILPSFKKLFDELINFKYFRAIIKGGRSSGKSVFISILVIVGTLLKKRSAVCVLSTKTDVQKRLDNVIKSTLSILGLSDYFRYVQTKHTFILKNTDGSDSDIEIICTGVDDAERVKGIKAKSGSFWCLWVEEATNFRNIKQIKTIESSVARGDLLHFVSIISYNPRQSSSHYLNKEYENITDGLIEQYTNEETHGSKTISEFQLDEFDNLKFKQVVFHCTYKALIKYGHVEWIAATDLVDIHIGEKTNSEYYRWYYLGEVVGQDSINVFRNVRDWDGNTDKLTINHIDRGLDVGNGGPDIWAYTETYYDKKERILYILSEYTDKGGDTIVQRVASNIRRINKRNLSFFIDSAVPLFKDLLLKEHLQPVAVKKYQGSVEAGILWLQSLQAIYICKQKTPVAYKEFTEYEYIVDKYEEVTNQLPDKNNHCIDSVRYGNYNNIRL